MRLEDRKSGVVWLQIPAKSMLLNTRIGQRMVDSCVHDQQRISVAPPNSSLGIEEVPPEAIVPTVPTTPTPPTEPAVPTTPMEPTVPTQPSAPHGPTAPTGPTDTPVVPGPEPVPPPAPA